MQLFPHPASPPAAVSAVTVSASIRRGMSDFVYRVDGPALLAEAGGPGRGAELWKHSCFELFVMPGEGPGYCEFNFAPSRQWAAYRFSGYRAGMADLEIPAPAIERLADGVRVRIDLGGLPDGAWRVGISAVIEEAGGRLSYWALAHPEGRADFHDPACFALGVAG